LSIPQVSDPFELSHVVRDQRQAKCPRMRCDEEVVGAEHRPAPLQVGADLSAVKRCVLVERQDLHVGQERGEATESWSRRGETATPYCSSAFVAKDMQTSMTGTDCRRLRTSGRERFMK
jgi:hypothetical protein